MELQEALDEYKKYFGMNYFHYVGFEKSEQEIIEEIQNCIRSGEKQKEPEYDSDKLYQIIVSIELYTYMTQTIGKTVLGIDVNYQRDNSIEYQKRTTDPENPVFSGFSLYSENLSNTLKTHKIFTVTNT